MKNKILLVLLLSSHVVFGQFVANTKMLQGSFGHSIYANGNDNKQNSGFKSHYINASIGTQITRIESETQQWGFGANLSFRDDRSQSFNVNSTANSVFNIHVTEFSYGLNIFQTRLKKILPQLYGGFRYSSGLGYSLQNTNTINEQSIFQTQPVTTTNNSSFKQNSISINIGITPQLYYFITPQWGLSANIGHLNATLGHYFKDDNWVFNSYSGFNSLGFGLFKILR